jgi:hypothetical protein
MVLKGCRLWAMGQLESTCSAPPWGRSRPMMRSCGLSRPVYTWKLEGEPESRVQRLDTTFSRHVILRGRKTPFDG